MPDNTYTLVSQLQTLGFSAGEAAIYLYLLKQPASHLELARATGINRTKVYRLAEQLQKRSLISVQSDGTGTFLVASDPATLEVALSAQEEKLRTQRQSFQQVLPELVTLRAMAGTNPLHFTVHTYEGEEGFKQMLWHELKTKRENVVFGSGTIEDLVPHSAAWGESFRQQIIDAGYTIRELLNPKGKQPVFTLHRDFMTRYTKRYISPTILLLRHQVVIYNSTVATYCWRDGQKVGFEVVNQAYADFMCGAFEQFWQMGAATEDETRQ